MLRIKGRKVKAMAQRMETRKPIREKKGRNNMKEKNRDKEKEGEKVRKVKSNKLLVNL